MERVHMDGGFSFVAAERVAAAVLEYALRLAEGGRFASLEVPVQRPDGTQGRVTLVLGPTTRISLESLDPVTESVNEDDWVESLEQDIADARADSAVHDLNVDLEKLLDV